VQNKSTRAQIGRCIKMGDGTLTRKLIKLMRCVLQDSGCLLALSQLSAHPCSDLQASMAEEKPRRRRSRIFKVSSQSTIQ
jgi:hypothetical protein